MNVQPPYDAAHPTRFLECRGSYRPEHEHVVWVLHTLTPRFLAGSDDNGVTFRMICWIDDEPPDTATEAALLMRELGDWYDAMLAETDDQN